MQSMIGRKVDVYVNLNKTKQLPESERHIPVYSVRDCETNKVVFHCRQLALADCTFVVKEAGRQRVIKTNQKNVHAWCSGTLTAFSDSTSADISGYTTAYYNPYKTPSFIDQNNSKVSSAKHALAYGKTILIK